LVSSFALSVIAASTVLGGCAAQGSDAGSADDAFSSNQATLLDFEFDGSLVTDQSFSDKQTITAQLLYTIGSLNQDNSVGRLDNLELSNVVRTNGSDGKIAFSYHAKLPVAWGHKDQLPTSYSFSLPKDVSQAGQQAFTDAHKDTCLAPEAEDPSPGNMWYYYRPTTRGCSLSAGEIVRVKASVKKSVANTTGKYPEYQKVWEDDRLEVVSIFGKFEASGGAGDAGVDGFNTFVRQTEDLLSGLGQVTTTPANLGDAPAPDTKDVTIEATLADGKKVKVTAFLVDAITSTWPGFAARYESLTPTADLVAYNGHSGLGQNVRALARMGRWVPNKYQIFFMNGCDSFSYVDGSLAQARAAINPADPTGTKFMEFVTNAMPSFFASMPSATDALVSGLLSTKAPKTYDQMFQGIDDAEVVLVTGEEDNVFQPGMPIGSQH
jgi:hypothetical protein